MSTLQIKPGAATEDASQIMEIVESMVKSMEDLNNAITTNIPSKVDTSWSNTLLDHWKKYYSSDIPETMEQMKLSSKNLAMAVREAIKYSQEQNQ